MEKHISHRFRQGNSPLLVSFPHEGSHIPDHVARTMTDAGRTSRDTDWFLSRLYDFPELADASLIIAEQSRYVIDVNRPKTDESLYPGLTTTGLIPRSRFDGEPIYETEPDDSEIARRIEDIWTPYHEKLEFEMDRLKNEFGIAVLIEAHSIESVLPMLFDGKLNDFNIGTWHGQTSDSGLPDAVLKVLGTQSNYSYVFNDRFVGGHITRHYGKPAKNHHAIQFELSQDTYLDDKNKTWDTDKANRVQPIFRSIISEINLWLATKQN